MGHSVAPMGASEKPEHWEPRQVSAPLGAKSCPSPGPAFFVTPPHPGGAFLIAGRLLLRLFGIRLSQCPQASWAIVPGLTHGCRQALPGLQPLCSVLGSLVWSAWPCSQSHSSVPGCACLSSWPDPSFGGQLRARLQPAGGLPYLSSLCPGWPWPLPRLSPSSQCRRGLSEGSWLGCWVALCRPCAGTSGVHCSPASAG